MCEQKYDLAVRDGVPTNLLIYNFNSVTKSWLHLFWTLKNMKDTSIEMLI